MQSIRNLMASDLIMVFGKKKSLRWFLIVLLAGILFGVLFSPMIFLIILPVYAVMLPSHLFKMTAEADRMYAILPVSRKSLVSARFLMLAGLFSAMALLCWLLSMIGVLIDLDAARLEQDLIEIFGMPDASSMYTVMIWLGYMIGMTALGIVLNKSFCVKKTVSKPVSLKGFLLALGIFIAFEGCIALLIISSVKFPLAATVLSMLMTLFTTMAGILNGLPVAALSITIGVGALLSGYVKTVIRYDKIEL